jgi:hypothetical protein
MGSKTRFVWERWVGLRREKGRDVVDFAGRARRIKRSICGVGGLESIMAVAGGLVVGIEVWIVDC